MTFAELGFMDQRGLPLPVEAAAAIRPAIAARVVAAVVARQAAIGEAVMEPERWMREDGISAAWRGYREAISALSEEIEALESAAVEPQEGSK